MSLINKVLQDLETRQDGAATTAPVYRNLRPVRAEPRVGPRRLLIAFLAVLLVGGAVYFGIERMGIGPSPVIVAKPTAVVAPPQPEPAPTPDPVIAEESKPLPVAAEAPVVATAVALPVEATKPQPVAPPRPAQTSPNDSAVRIVNVNELKPAPSHKGERKSAEAKVALPKSETVAMAKSESAGLVDKKARPLTAEDRAEADYRRAVRLLDQGRPDDALRQLRESLAEQPKHVKARELAAGIALQIGHWREAQTLLEEGLRELPNQYVFARLLARVYIDRGAEAKALAVMESAAPSGSDDAEFSALLALLYQRAGRHAEAVQAYERALALRPDDARTWLGFAISLEAVEQFGPATNAYQRATQSGLEPALARYTEQRLAVLRDR